MSIINFLIVLAFNLWWLLSYGLEGIIEIYSGQLNKWISLYAWLYASWGIGNLIYFLIQH